MTCTADSGRSAKVEPQPNPDATTSSAPTANDRPTRLPILPVVGLSLFVAVAVLLTQYASRLTHIAGVLAAAAMLAWLARPLQLRIQRRAGSGAAIGALLVGFLAIAGGGMALLASDLTSGAEQLAADVRADRAAPSGSFADRLSDALKIGEGFARWLEKVPQTIVYGESASDRLADVASVAVLFAFLMISGPAMLAWFVSLWTRDERANAWKAAHSIERTAGATLRRILATAFVVTAILAPLGMLIDLPVPIAAALWAGVWLTVPTVGWLVAMAPYALFAVVSSPWRGLAMIAAVALLAVLIARRTRSAELYRPGLTVTVIGLTIGSAVGGSAAAILFWFLAVLAAGVARATGQYRVALPTPVITDRTVRLGPLAWPHGWRGALAALAAVVVAVIAWDVAASASSALVAIVVAALIAIALDRPVTALARRLHLSRRWALAALLAVVVAAPVAMAISLAEQGPGTAALASERVPTVIRDLEDAPLIGSWLADNNVAETVDRQLTNLPERVAHGRGVVNWFPSAGSAVLQLAWVLLLIIGFSLEGGRLRSAVERRVPALHRRQFTRLLDVGHRALAGYAAGAVLVSAMNGAVVFVLATVFGLGLALVLALWAFLWDFVPPVGGVVAGVPLVLLALVDGTTTFVIVTAVYLVYQMIESNVIFPAIIGDKVDIPAWAAMAVALAGSALAGVLGAIVLTPLVGVARLILLEYRRADFPGRTVSVTPTSL